MGRKTCAYTPVLAFFRFFRLKNSVSSACFTLWPFNDRSWSLRTKHLNEILQVSIPNKHPTAAVW